MSAAHPAGLSSPRTRWRLAVIASAASAGMLAACSGGGSPATRPAAASGAATTSPAPHDPAPMALQITPAPYQLPGGISREVVLPSGADLLIAGGLTAGSTTTDAVTRLNLATGQTHRAGRLASAAHDAAGAVLAGRPLVFGGGVTASSPAVQTLSPGRTATLSGRLPTAWSDLASVTLGSTAYLLGGYDGASYQTRVLATADGRRFRAVARLRTPVRYPAVAGLGNRLWVFGGQTPSGPTSDIQQVNLATGRSAVVGHLPTAVMGAVAFSLAGRVYVAGGQAGVGSGPVSGAVLAFDPAHRHLTRAGTLPVPVVNAAVAVDGGAAYIVGGDNGQRAVPSVTVLRLVSEKPAATTTAASGPGAASITGPAAAGVPSGAALRRMFGGRFAVTATAMPWLSPAHGRGHLARGSDPSALPGDILIADNWNNRLLIVDPQGRIRWQFPRPGDLRHGQKFLLPDDAFFSPNGRYIVATEEEDSVISVISVATHRIVYRYGTPGTPGPGPNHVANPDDAMMMPNGDILTADIENCRLLVLTPPSHRPHRIIGQTGVCAHNPPHTFGSPNGAFPTTTGRYLVTEINGDWANMMGLAGHVYWSANPPGVSYPSDTNEIYPGRYLTADYSPAGQVVEFNSRGHLLWRFGGLNHPSLAQPLPNGDILVNDDYNDRVIVIDPSTHRIVWQYGHTGVPGTRPGYLNDPDGIDLTPPNSMLISHGATMGLPGLRPLSGAAPGSASR